LPTWYTIRVSKQGFLARRDEHEIVVAMNPATFAKDLAEVCRAERSCTPMTSSWPSTALTSRLTPCR